MFDESASAFVPPKSLPANLAPSHPPLNPFTMADYQQVALAYPGVFNAGEARLDMIHKGITVCGILVAVAFMIKTIVALVNGDGSMIDNTFELIAAALGAVAAVDIFYVLQQSNMTSLKASFTQFIETQKRFLDDQNARDAAREAREIERDARDAARDQREVDRDQREVDRDQVLKDIRDLLHTFSL